MGFFDILRLDHTVFQGVFMKTFSECSVYSEGLPAADIGDAVHSHTPTRTHTLEKFVVQAALEDVEHHWTHRECGSVQRLLL